MSDIYLWRVIISKKYHDEETIHSWARDKDEAIVHALNQILDLNHEKVLSITAHHAGKLLLVADNI